MRILNSLSLTFLDYPDPVSHAIIIYFVGCDNGCEGCHNPEFKDYYHTDSQEVSVINLNELIIPFAFRSKTTKLVFSGGDPLFLNNIKGVNTFIREYKDSFDICIYTGKSIEFVKQNVEQGFKFVKVNQFDIFKKRESKKTDDFFQLSSDNQEIYNFEYNCLTENGIYYFDKEELQDVRKIKY